MKRPILITLLILVCAITNGFAQTSKFFGIWEMLVPPGMADKTPYHSILRSFDEKGNYTQIAVTKNGTFIEARASFEALPGDTVKEVYDFAANPSKIGKTYFFNYEFQTKGNMRFLITKGPGKVVDGVKTFAWVEVWRKIEDYSSN